MENPFEILFDKLNRIELMLSDIKSDIDQIKSGSMNHSEIMNMDDAANFLYISKATLYSYTSSRKIPHCKAGRRIYFNKVALLDWLSKNKRKTIDEINEEVDSYILKRRRK